mgnify:CR=1 FL=1
MDQVPTTERYQIIYDTISNDNNELNIITLCEIAQVSRSGYYAWTKRKNDINNQREIQDKKDFELILEAYKYRGYKKGSRSIHMRLLHQGTVMNRKKIRRLMKKFNLICPIRKPNPYKQMAKAIEVSTVADNLVNREFRNHGPRKILLTDITYLFYGKCNKAYLSVIKDAYTKEVLSYVLSDNLKEDFVLLTINTLINNHKNELGTDTLLHSDQGIHYKSYTFQQLLKDEGLRQSMSRKANCWDNAPQESFFGHMKDELNLTDCTIFEDVKNKVDDYMDYYNNDRYQWDLAKLSPKEFYQYTLTGNYPINKKEKDD